MNEAQLICLSLCYLIAFASGYFFKLWSDLSIDVYIIPSVFFIVFGIFVFIVFAINFVGLILKNL